MANTLTYTINLNGNAYSGVTQLNTAMSNLEKKTKAQTSLFDRLSSSVRKVNAFIYAGEAIFGSITSAIQDYTTANDAQAEAEAKLGAVMRNTMGATEADIEAIKKLTSAQQALGIVGDEVQLAGAQELGTYLTKRESLEKLIPVMNEMVAQQYGLNATQESAVNIATMMGKVMDGQVGALSRYGYKFDEAQEKILQYGTEAERVATLADVITSAVGGVNAALAATPEGKMQQAANAIGDMKERIGSVLERLQVALIPLMEQIMAKVGTLVSYIEENQGTIAAIIIGTSTACAKLLGILGKVISFISNTLPIWAGLATAIGVVTAFVQWQEIALGFLIAKETIVIAVTKLWSGTQAILNAVMTANPIGLIIAGIAVLVGAIVYVCQHLTGWGTLWDGIMGFMKYSFYAFVDAIKLYFSTYINGFLIGLDKIKLGWYKFKEACGIGDSAENQKAIAAINADVEARQKTIVDGAKSVMDNAVKAKDSLVKGFSGMSWQSSSSEEKIGAGNTAKIGVQDQLVNAANGNSSQSASQGSMPGAQQSTSAVATGGTRNTSITIRIEDMIKQVIFNGSTEDNKASVEKNFAECLYRVLGMAQNSI